MRANSIIRVSPGVTTQDRDAIRTAVVEAHREGWWTGFTFGASVVFFIVGLVYALNYP